MLKLTEIVKDYRAGDNIVRALDGISVEFRKSEFVSVLGASGCGKTTLLNIIGGLDRYTSGQLNIDGQDTDTFRSVDWDLYRNQRIGFIFQSYNLIPQISILANVELALTLSGVPAKERKKRAQEALEKVGLGAQVKKKPNQLSGGQMQRVSIARALINNPDIILADEPTGALDSTTSVNVMELLKEIAKDRLVIMVTHNPELAEQYSTRIIRMSDGKIIGDTMPYDSGAEEEARARAEKDAGAAQGGATFRRPEFKSEAQLAADMRGEREHYYAVLRQRAQERAEANRKRAENDGEFASWDATVKRGEIELAKAEVFSPKEAETIREKLLSARRAREKALARLSLSDADLQPRYACPKCSDTGFLPDGRACDCYPAKK